MRCLLDKVTARHIMEGMLRLVEGRTVTSAELVALYLYRRARSSGIELFITPQTESLLRRLEHLPRYTVLIRRFLGTTKVTLPARYFKRWARRLREYGFTKEDSENRDREGQLIKRNPRATSITFVASVASSVSCGFDVFWVKWRV